MSENAVKKVLDEYVVNTDFTDFKSHNGPYHDGETPVRTIAHYLSFLCSYNRKFKISNCDEIITRLDIMLHDSKYRPGNATFYCRDGGKKDKTNGVIGQAWVIEALVELYLYTGKEQYIDEAKKTFKLHPLDSSNGIWHCVDLKGNVLPCDMTFNHQLWFAAMGAYINSVSEDTEIKRQVDCFVKHLDSIFEVHKNGLVKHKICPRELKQKVKYRIKDLREYYWNCINKPSMEYKEIGYHSFNMYGFAMLFEYYGDNKFFKSSKFLKALGFCGSNYYKNGLSLSNHRKDINYKNLQECSLKCNRYGYSYNVSGYEILYVAKVFGKISKNIFIEEEEFFNRQKKYTLLSNEYEDKTVVNSRTYELLRIF